MVTLEEIAMHEAGHGVFAVLVGAEGVSMELTPYRTDYLGRYYIEVPPVSPVANALIALGGPVVSALIECSDTEKGGRGDFDAAVRALKETGTTNPEASARRLWMMGLDYTMRSPSWAEAFHAVGNALLQKGRLSDAEIRAVMNLKISPQRNPICPRILPHNDN